MVAISGGFTVPFGRGLDPAQLVRQASRGALDDAGLDEEQVDHVVVANAAAEGLNGIANVAVWTVTHAGLAGTPAVRVETGPSSGLAGLAVARALVGAGHAERVLLVGWEAMTHVDTAEATRVLGQLMAPDERRTGLSLPALVALLTSAYQARYQVDDAALARVAVKAHGLAAGNPVAHFRDPVTVDDVLASRPISLPVRLLHCAPLSDGAAAVVVARDGPIRIEGMGHATDALGLTQRRSPPERFAATGSAARHAFGEAGLGPRDVDVVELHDAFSVLEPVNLEDLGLAEPGRGLEHLPEPGADPLACSPAVNPSGGLKARGHPIGATGVAQLVELYDQLVGRAANQVDGPRVGLAHNIGGFGNNVHCALLGLST